MRVACARLRARRKFGTAIAASKVPGVRAATAHDLTPVRGSVENYDAQVLCMGQDVIAGAKDDRPEAIPFWLEEIVAGRGEFARQLREHRLDGRCDRKAHDGRTERAALSSFMVRPLRMQPIEVTPGSRHGCAAR